MKMLTRTPRDLHRRGFLVPKASADGRPNTEFLVYSLFEFGGSFVGEQRWNCAFHYIAREIYTTKADEMIRFCTRLSMSK
jgi:hypothetical protein